MAEKSEEATPKRLEDARRRGQVAVGRDVPSAFVVLSVTGLFVVGGAAGLAEMEALFALTVRAITPATSMAPEELLRAGMLVGLRVALPILAVAMIAGVAGFVLQIGPLWAPRALEPRLDRFDLVKGFGQMFSKDALLEALRSIAKIGIIGWIAWVTMRDGLRATLSLSGRSPAEALSTAGGLLVSLGLRTGFALLVIGLLEILWRRWKHRQDLRMTKEEVQRESKESEGDPHAKQERQRAHQELLTQSAVEAARTASVIVVNPTHVAVALRYEEDEMEAPLVVAKGEDHVARRIVEAAREAGVPIMRDVPLARALFDLEIGDEIPEPLYEAVAAVLHAAAEEEGSS